MALRHCVFKVHCPNCPATYLVVDTISCSVAAYLQACGVSSHPKRCGACGYAGYVREFREEFMAEITWGDVRKFLAGELDVEKPGDDESPGEEK